MTEPVKNTSSLPFLTPHENPAQSRLGRFWSWITGRSLTQEQSKRIQPSDKPTELTTARKIIQIAKERLDIQIDEEKEIRQSSSLRSRFISQKTPDERLKEEIGHVMAKALSTPLTNSDYATLKKNINTALIEDLSKDIKNSLSEVLNTYHSPVDRGNLLGKAQSLSRQLVDSASLPDIDIEKLNKNKKEIISHIQTISAGKSKKDQDALQTIVKILEPSRPSSP